MKRFFKRMIQQWLWSLEGRCDACGGEIYVWDERKAYCLQCRKRH